MTEQTPRLLSDSKTARWTALFIVSFTMLCGYFMADVMSPLKTMLESSKGWNSQDFGLFNSAYGWFNVFFFMLIIGGMILDKMGVRFTGILASIIMIIGTSLVYFALTTETLNGLVILHNRATVMVAATGYAIFGVGIEVIGITATKVIVKWFRGREMALGMGIQVATARIGTGMALLIPLPLAHYYMKVASPVMLALIMLCVGLAAFFVFTFMDKKLDKSIKDSRQADDDSEAFRLRDILSIIKNKGFWYVAILCVLFYSAVFPFIKYATDLMIQKFHVPEDWAGSIPAALPFGTMVMTPFFGNLYDRKGKGATIMILGAILIILVHTVLAIPFLNQKWVAICMMLVLGVGFSLVPSAMWPSVPKIIPERQLGTAYATIFWLQNMGALMGIPYLIGWILDKYCVTGHVIKEGVSMTTYNYTLPMMIFASCGVLALIFALLLKAEDRKKGYGLELPNIKK